MKRIICCFPIVILAFLCEIALTMFIYVMYKTYQSQQKQTENKTELHFNYGINN